MTGIYIHVPFCKRKCPYCDFYSVCRPELYEDYTQAVCRNIEAFKGMDIKCDTIYFGGGTPSFLGADGLVQILNAVRRRFSVSGNGEITFEANPDSVTEKLLKRLRAEGFNRISLGVQSDDDGLLKKLGRPHSYRQAVQAVELARKVGFHNLSLDLMYGLPGQSLTAWEETLEHALELSPEHMSCYGLKVEEGTPLYDVKDFVGLADDDTQADMYMAAVEALRNHGFRQYEISNFCRKGLYSRHNTKYWTGGEYLGFGPSASSDFAGKRFTMVRDLQAYIQGIQTGGNIMEDVQEIPLRERAGEYLMLRLRTTAGILAEEYERTFMLPFKPLEEVLLKHRVYYQTAQGEDGRWYLTPRGFLVSNDIISDLLLAQDDSEPLKRL